MHDRLFTQNKIGQAQWPALAVGIGVIPLPRVQVAP